MLPRLRAFCASLGMTVALAQPLAAQMTARPVYAAGDSPTAVLDRFGRWLDAMAITDSLSGIVAIARHGKILLSRVSGIAVIDDND